MYEWFCCCTRLRPYSVKRTVSRPNCAVKPLQALSVLRGAVGSAFIFCIAYASPFGRSLCACACFLAFTLGGSWCGRLCPDDQLHFAPRTAVHTPRGRSLFLSLLVDLLRVDFCHVSHHGSKMRPRTCRKDEPHDKTLH